MIDINITLLIQLVNFLVCIFMLNKLIIGPILGVINKRREINDGLKNDAASLQRNSTGKLSEYEARIVKVRSEIASAREAGKADGQREFQARIEAAGAEARGIRQAVSDKVAQESADARKALQDQVGSFAQMAIGKLLG